MATLGLLMHVMLVGAAALPASELQTTWQTWKGAHKRVYTSVKEDARRMAIFAQSKEFVEKHNSRVEKTWTAALNAFSDLTWEEFKQAKLMDPQECSATHTSSNWTSPNVQIPEAIDWRDYLPGPWPVKNQAHCGSCWTFSTIGTMEAHYAWKYKAMVNLSEQQLVDCAGAFNNFGCNGGLPSQAFEYLHYAGGADTEAAYPYTGVTGTTCNYDGNPAAQVADVVNITALNERELLDALGKVGPVSIAFQVSDDFRFYSDGVYDGVCDRDPDKVNHAVVAVGYGVANPTTYAVPYYTVRNSWGADWGVDGYFMIKRGVNKCGLADCASYPIVG
eukprot:CAMPEP_0183352714 /NCGR_PEP_ID=MMETSP0164_2-20130417/29981_1 /TAXON_ID=221442 /ORGANISM="Coccolithus pelagicus ssp braarudi, Strain PLY182g" /LENGTH=332 /DNA_ID=CAMNT_0025525225 /DNA_START=45 /DNA_END=1043 /DNA_ORIENTATION=+